MLQNNLYHPDYEHEILLCVFVLKTTSFLFPLNTSNIFLIASYFLLYLTFCLQ